ncbi:bifunctional hydroxymethylpyrimidine kinase/phosphomethylpyrimidine kinase [Roseibium denhamense]|uniref:hydroxymethylpyrimidine kinase n=1 Tax=Roseibium denhamense TaxID=76305 RepID=A0ABY1N967_9HYPH|nr:bifunctional hydroxymethylpyrimidine kinase/phosphomethylpyrimidine kinase [Roseibium denhamense]MTI05642.1 bifunctional hydroxymethylpyrimidine kinase/phosphomethylpyrimidine kinase [Roseibium denhamense]SMP03459.1 hydroxymethylpyrimidine kinase /phosphomethylpyrimidine kinase [Roseibium denhamense]
MTAIAVTIAGSDSGGGAGIQADLKSFSANGVFGASVLTALTAQNTKGVFAIHDVPPEFVRAQIDAVYSDLEVSATKIGMLSRVEVIEAVADGLKAHSAGPIVLDPVMVAASGDPLLADSAVAGLIEILVPLADVLTPNLHEAARMLSADVAQDDAAMEDQARRLLALGPKSVLLKGGHGTSDESADLFLAASGETFWLRSPRIATVNTHGTGCSLSSAIAAGLAKGQPVDEVVRAAKAYIQSAIAASNQLQIGQGHGPVHHFHHMWS